MEVASRSGARPIGAINSIGAVFTTEAVWQSTMVAKAVPRWLLLGALVNEEETCQCIKTQNKRQRSPIVSLQYYLQGWVPKYSWLLECV